MIFSAFIKEWSHVAPWPQMYQVEQDLIISRALVELFNRSSSGGKPCLRRWNGPV
jgi:hypothetical protein